MQTTREEAARAAEDVQSGARDLFEGVGVLVAFLDAEFEGRELEDSHWLLKGILADAAIYPVGDARATWTPQDLARADGQRAQFEAAVRRDVLLACRAFLAKYGG